MSEVEICQLAYEGKTGELKHKIDADESLATKADQSGRMALHWACCGGREEIAEFLLTQCGVEVDARDSSNWTPLMIAVSAGREQITRSLMARGAQVNAVNSTGQCPLHYAASKDRYQIAELLLEHGADCNIGDCVSNTPLHRAAYQGHTKMTKLLLSYNADPNHQDCEGNSPLHGSLEDRRIEEAKLLVDHGASISLKNKAEKTPLDLADPGHRRQLERLAQANIIPT